MYRILGKNIHINFLLNQKDSTMKVLKPAETDGRTI